MKKILISSFICSSLLLACKMSKKTKVSQLSTTTTAATTQADSSINTRPVYRASYTKTNDLLHTRLEISFNWDSCFAYGKAILTFRPYFYPTNTLELDAKGMIINKVQLAGSNKDLVYNYDGKKLTINLDKTYTRTDEYAVFIDYVSQPNKLKSGGSAAITSDKGLYFINPQGKEKNKPREIWTQGETESNSCWIPTIDGPQEKHTQEFYITVENKYTTLSNGSLVYSTLNGDGTRTDCWKMDLPHSTYLSMMAIGEYAIVKDKWRDMEVNYYVEPAYEKYARHIFGNTPEMIELFSKKLGVDFAWDKYAQVIARDYVSGAMENTTATLHGEFLQINNREYEDVGRANEDVISHELFHQWFGDLVTTESWSNLPLNESFATYGEYIWAEYKYGRDDADMIGQNDLSVYLGSEENRNKDVVRFNYNDREDMFDGVTYQKGGRILHMLRKYVGDDAFFASLKLYLERNKFKNAEMHDLRLAFEEVTGEDLNWFFNEWWYNHGNPELNISYSYDDQNKKATVKILQTQDLANNPLYKIPMDVDIYSNGKKERTRISLEQKEQIFDFFVQSKPDLINVDAEKMILGTKTDLKGKEELVFQYNHAPLYLDRYESLQGLQKFKDDEAAQAIIIKALNDPFWNIRSFALLKVKNLSDANKNLVYENIKEMALKDPVAKVREQAISVLGSVFSDKDYSSVLSRSGSDSSYGVVAATIRVLSKSNKEQAKLLAKQNEHEKSNNLSQSIADLYAKEGTASENPFFLHYFENASGFSPLFMINPYKNYLRRMDDKTIREGISALHDLYKVSTIQFVKNSAKGAIKDLLKMYEEQHESDVNKQKSSEEMSTFIKGQLEDLN